jgi:hypothetical protein
MALQSSFYLIDGSTRTYPSTKHIATKQHCIVYKKKVSDGLWIVVNTDDYSLVNNSIIFITAQDQVVYSQVEIRVADGQDELLGNPSDIMIVAGIASQVLAVAAIDDEVVIVANNIASVVTDANNIADINTVSGDIASVVILANAISAGGVSGTGGGGQFLGNSVVKAVEFMANTSNENLVTPTGTNCFSVDSLVFENGGSLTISNGSTYKIL